MRHFCQQLIVPSLSMTRVLLCLVSLILLVFDGFIYIPVLSDAFFSIIGYWCHELLSYPVLMLSYASAAIGCKKSAANNQRFVL